MALVVQVISRHRGRLPYSLLIIHTHKVKVDISKGLGEGYNKAQVPVRHVVVLTHHATHNPA